MEISILSLTIIRDFFEFLKKFTNIFFWRIFPKISKGGTLGIFFVRIFKVQFEGLKMLKRPKLTDVTHSPWSTLP